LLGTLEVRTGEGPVSLGRTKQRALLALLALNANRVVARDRLIDGLWGESPPPTAAKSVQVSVSRLRKLLPAGTLVTRPPGYVLEVEPDAVDLLRFERLVAEARAAEPARASTLLREALELWRGPPLAEFPDEPFARVEARRLEDVRLAALEDRLEADLALGRHAEVAGELEALVAAEPHRERLRAQLMLALYRTGRQAAALGAFRDARAALDELGLEPGAGLRRLEKQILTHDPALDFPSARVAERVPLPGPLVPSSPFPFVGRSDELAALRTALERAVAGEGGLVLLTGAAGAGKTRLVCELATEAAAGGVLVLYGTSDAAVSTPYRPLREWLEFLLRICDPETLRECLAGGREVLARLVPELARVTGVPAPPPGDPEGDRYLLQSAAVELLRRLGGRQPLLLVAEDVHWAESETLHLLGRLARTAPETRLLVVASYREPGEELDPQLVDTLADLSRVEGVARIPLGNLSIDEVATFVRASANVEAAPELLFALAELTDGTPLLVCELWRDLRESGGVVVGDTGMRLARPVSELRGPERVQVTVRQRLAHLEPETAALVELAAVAGAQFELRVLAAAAEREQAMLVAPIEEAVRNGMLEELPGAVAACRFTHELVRRAIYDRLTGLRRAELHLRVGEGLERVHAADPDRVLPELAHHFALAAPIAGGERGVDYNLRAAEAAVAAAAYDSASTSLSAALELGIRDPRRRLRVQVELSYLLYELGRRAESDVILAECLEAATDLDERGIVARALVDRAGHEIFSDPELDPRAVERVARDAIETLVQVDDRTGLAAAGRLLGIALRNGGRGADAAAALERALAHADASRDWPTLRRVVGTLAAVLCDGPAPACEAIRRCDALLQAYRSDRVLEGVLFRFLSLLLAMAGRFDEAGEHVRRSSVVLDGLPLLTMSSVFRVFASRARDLLGDTAGAEQELLEMWRGMQRMREAGPDGRALNAADRLALLFCDQGRWDEAAECLSYGAEVDGPHLYRLEAVLRLAARARVHAHRGELAEALTLARRAVGFNERTDLLDLRAQTWLALAEVHGACGATAEADAAVAQALRLYDAKGNVAAAGRLRAARSAGVTHIS
jgi:DNA-binding SARP family transcriptional activator